MPGPVPNRSEDLNRPRTRKSGGEVDVTKGVALKSEAYAPDPAWHPIARRLYDSLILSGQSAFYQQSDWAIAFSLCDDLSFYKSQGYTKEDGTIVLKRSGQMLQTIMSSLSNLLVTEADRRRVRIELDEPEEETTPASVTAIKGYRDRLKVAPPAE